jgi:DNA invertase Pin-like site-specific DNA recombinase
MRVAIYARVSTVEQSAENQLGELRRYVAARGWQPQEYCDTGISGAKDKRPALDVLIRDAKRRKFDALVVWKMDRLGRNLKHLITLLEELQSLGIAFVSIGEGIDATTPAGKLQMHILGAIAEFERGRIAERVKLGMVRARAQGKHLGRPRNPVTDDQIAAAAHLPLRKAAALLGVSKSFLNDWRLSRRVA